MIFKQEPGLFDSQRQALLELIPSTVEQHKEENIGFGHQKMAKMGVASEAELLLYRVLQRANLTQYYETFIQQGGDDIRQLCEAGEEEFLEIMALVGMASKPLHVRRLQKALQEWITTPSMFEKPIGPCTPPPPMAAGSIVSTVGRPPNSAYGSAHIRSSTPSRSDSNPTPPQGWIPNPDSRSSSPNPSGLPATVPINIEPTSSGSHSDLLSQQIPMPVYITEPAPMWKSPGLTNGSNGLDRHSISPTPSTDSDSNLCINLSVGGSGSHNGTMVNIPTLTEQQQLSIEAACESLASELPNYEPKPLNMKKEINREIAELMNMSEDHPEKLTHLRKYSAIYGRFDSKRKNDSKMSLHEVSVNEAAAQLCKRIPALLTRRDDLYPLSRRAVRDSGYQYSKGHSRATSSMEIPPNKKPKMDNTKKALTFISAQHETRITEINKEIDEIIKHQEEIKSKMVVARSNKDFVLLELLRHELEKCASRQLQLRMEQSGIVGSGRNKVLTKPKTEPNINIPVQVALSTPEERDNISIVSDSSDNTKDRNGVVHNSKDFQVVPNSKEYHQHQHPIISSQELKSILLSSTTNSKSSTESKQEVQNNVLDLRAMDSSSGKSNSLNTSGKSESSLLDEGLRIAQQYGMCDLAEELKYMKDDSSLKDEDFESGNSEVDEQEEWNREVERDLAKLQSPASGSKVETSSGKDQKLDDHHQKNSSIVSVEKQ